MDNYLQVWYVDEVEKNDEEKVPAGYTLVFMPSPHGAGESCASSLTPDEFNTKETLEMDVCNFWDWLIDLRKKKKKKKSGFTNVMWKSIYQKELLGGVEWSRKGWETRNFGDRKLECGQLEGVITNVLGAVVRSHRRKVPGNCWGLSRKDSALWFCHSLEGSASRTRPFPEWKTSGFRIPA